MNKLFAKAMDPISSETHFIGACLSLFGISLIALYSASSIYHFFKGSQKIKTILRKLDHSMIYILIVGTYTPVAVYCMSIPHVYYFLGILWSVAILGIIIKICWLNAPRSIATAIYLILGWAIVFDFHSFQGIPMNCLMMIAAGGIAYSIGAFIYIFKKPNISEAFGFHELFHIFVMLGSLLHYFAIILFIL